MNEWGNLSLGLKLVVMFSSIPTLIIAYLIVTKVPKFIYLLFKKKTK
jgi:hypothetical protein